MVVTVTEQTGEEGSVTRDREFQYVRKFLVDAGTATARASQILALAAIPLPFEPYPGDPRALALQPKAVQLEDHPWLWEVTVSYSSKIDDPQENENPLKRPAKVAFRTEQYRRITVVDAFGDPILNSAGDLIEVERDDTRLVISVEKNVASVPRWIGRYSDASNKDRVRIRGQVFTKGTLKFQGLAIPPREKTENDVTFVPLAFELHHRAEGWQEVVPNRGFNEAIKKTITLPPPTGAATPRKVTVTRLEKIKIGDPATDATEPVWLDKNGKAFRDEGDRVRLPKVREMILLKIPLYKLLRFRVLPLN